MGEKITLVVFSNELDKLLCAFNLAVGASAMGTETTMYFTFWGINILKKEGKRIQCKGVKRKMLNLMNRGGVKKLPLSKLNLLGFGPWMMRKMMKDSHMLPIEEMITLAKKQGVKFIACSPTMELMGLRKEDLIEEVDEIAGVATYLGTAGESRINLFI